MTQPRYLTSACLSPGHSWGLLMLLTPRGRARPGISFLIRAADSCQAWGRGQNKYKPFSLTSETLLLQTGSCRRPFPSRDPLRSHAPVRRGDPVSPTNCSCLPTAWVSLWLCLPPAAYCPPPAFHLRASHDCLERTILASSTTKAPPAFTPRLCVPCPAFTWPFQ